MASDAGGDFVVVWRSYGQDGSNMHDEVSGLVAKVAARDAELERLMAEVQGVRAVLARKEADWRRKESGTGGGPGPSGAPPSPAERRESAQ